MHHFNIRDVENLSGIKAHTLRIWEQRYKVNFCKRKESRHRYYDNDDLKQILRIAHLYHKGYKISKIAELAEDDILSLTRNQAKGDADAAINKLVESALDYDETRFEECIQEAIT
ncbi:MAG: MerR family transcriptional regulator, partial [Gemmatimonadaceae bacterium]|nr:MerR family transcriptional regulator [Chitinophagaceae bacterium]